MDAIYVVGVAVVAFFGGLLVKSFLPAYVKEKGKNLATKEDIEEITSKIESIKSQLQFSLHAGLSWRQEEHDALVSYYSKLEAWLSAIRNCSFAEIWEDDEDELREIRAGLEMVEREFDLVTGRMQLFVDNPEIIKRHFELMPRILEFHAHAIEATLLFKQQLLEIRQMKIGTPVHEQVEAFQPLLVKRQEFYQRFKKEQHGFFSDIYPLIADQRSTISSHIKRLIVGGNQ